MNHASLASVLQHPAVWLGDGRTPVLPTTMPSSYGVLDAQLPGGGWAVGSVTEILLANGAGSGELSLLWPALGRIARAREVVLIAPPHVPYAPAWQQAGVDPGRTLWLQPSSVTESLWAMEQALREPACGAVLGWIQGFIDDRACRRLQLAARAGQGYGFLLRAGRGHGASSPLPLRLSVATTPQGWQIHILKRRGLPLTTPLNLTHEEARHALAGHPSAFVAAGSLSAAAPRLSH
ncbi:translesion DNA synthesis-associated protein ImuA [Silvimonas amylolytica]|uniref:Translesion DNA synthesis-associated protein ImuA n=1 Tax=Silvimonas amylolytica TaxID=449663 RepID=A0ABQ2PHC7_9NEIS|nr:translesion DNA synthesis-associated protein ImuA [Silvimonas amylolytica]GGP24758.1 hypothetical protein GCM10010971_05770 [Silvimonas amylolytica]